MVEAIIISLGVERVCVDWVGLAFCQGRTPLVACPR
jgi:hypothetical protein